MTSLLPCPFCGAGETSIRENRLNRMPDMSGKQSPIVSVEIHHWCTPVERQPNRNTITRTGRDMESAIAAWNLRAPPPLPTREEVEATIRQHLRLQWTGSHFAVDARSITISADAMLRTLRGEGL